MAKQLTIFMENRPGRINSVCDRLMLFGYLNDKKEFDARDVDEVAGEIFEETQGNSSDQRQRAAGRASRSGSNLANIPSDGDVQPPNTSKRRRRSAAPVKEFEVSSREDLNHLLAGLNAWQFNERLGRLEQSLQQLELINGTTLSLLQKIVSSLVPDNEEFIFKRRLLIIASPSPVPPYFLVMV